MRFYKGHSPNFSYTCIVRSPQNGSHLMTSVLFCQTLLVEYDVAFWRISTSQRDLEIWGRLCHYPIAPRKMPGENSTCLEKIVKINTSLPIVFAGETSLFLLVQPTQSSLGLPENFSTDWLTCEKFHWLGCWRIPSFMFHPPNFWRQRYRKGICKFAVPKPPPKTNGWNPEKQPLEKEKHL